MEEWLLATILGLIQGVLEWLPVSSEGSVALALTALSDGSAPVEDTQFALVLHLGTAMAAMAYYREDIGRVLGDIPSWHPKSSFDGNHAELSFLGIATAVSFATGGLAYLTLETVISTFSGGAFVALIGVLLVGTGLLQRTAEGRAVQVRERADLLDAVLVGGLQGLAILPGVSRSGTTVSALLLRGHEGERSLELSFLLSIPAALAAGAFVLVREGVPSISPGPALLALALSAGVGYLTVGALVALVRRVAFWGVCVGFGTLAILGGGILLL